jgi:glutamate-1-semialdehyde aminotransferase
MTSYEFTQMALDIATDAQLAAIRTLRGWNAQRIFISSDGQYRGDSPEHMLLAQISKKNDATTIFYTIGILPNGEMHS